MHTMGSGDRLFGRLVSPGHQAQDQDAGQDGEPQPDEPEAEPPDGGVPVVVHSRVSFYSNARLIQWALWFPA